MNFTRSPKVLRGALIQQSPLLDRPRVVTFQYNPDSITRTLGANVQDGGRLGHDRLSRRARHPNEQIFFTAHFDASDALADSDAATKESGLLPVLSALEFMIEVPRSGLFSRIARNLTGRSRSQPLTLLVWGRHRTVPVRIEHMKIAETAFDPELNPIRAAVDLSLRVLTPDSLRRNSRGYQIYKAYLSSKESLASSLPAGDPPG